MASQANEISDSARWLLVSRRDLSANSSFFYGVKSTQIFCRPTCPGRVARRGNVIFFNDLQHASQSGYRPCKRCEPCNDSWSRDNSGRRIAYRAHAMIVAAEADNVKWTVESMARKLGITSAHLHRQFKKCFLMTPKAFSASLGAPEGSSAGHMRLDGQALCSDYMLPETTTDLEDLYAVDNFAHNFTSWFADDMDSLTSIDFAADPGS
ncbi:Bifunctional transcriptional activator/DNA repair enzyme Ada [Colletotrichum fructicola]|uniref:DNA repair and transcription factor ada n=1 Tax=Colletotrichum fructicola (strain Nara gc5) TaxID=1213859 RepID=L2FYC3_COLFN|nr:Bifunctional transcriptional activator/DNA repair enzyme Ada [Colletotrichum fructicola]KAF4912567.1 Bifunctional transcriptional activator/DNA repair enzyme Ada [Colletotrichum fructicola]KAF4940612.1 Bifunctional transcriptional activator/DNA repair enzyme Ada [Colletotrichum fructicola]